MIKLKEWYARYMPEFPAMSKAWADSGYKQEVMDACIDEIMKEHPTET